jgi:HTH-type transcriptional regulator/antitoxin MqsA
MERFENETFAIEHAGAGVEVRGLSGWRCRACGEVEFDAGSARRYAAAGDKLVLRARKHQQEELRRIRLKLGLSQVKAARLTGGGHNAFSRYERGEAAPMPAVVNLFMLLDRHPELLRELQRQGTKASRTANVRAARSGPSTKASLE